MTERERPVINEETFEPAPARESERGDVVEPDAPTSGEENEGMSTVLSGEPPLGVQKDANDE